MPFSHTFSRTHAHKNRLTLTFIRVSMAATSKSNFNSKVEISTKTHPTTGGNSEADCKVIEYGGYLLLGCGDITEEEHDGREDNVFKCWTSDTRYNVSSIDFMHQFYYNQTCEDDPKYYQVNYLTTLVISYNRATRSPVRTPS